MGTKHLSSNGREWRETAYLMQAFQDVNNVVLRVFVSCSKRGNEPDLSIEASAFTNEDAPVVPVLLASVKLSANGSELVSLTSLFTHAMYRLDARLAEVEFERTQK